MFIARGLVFLDLTLCSVPFSNQEFVPECIVQVRSRSSSSSTTSTTSSSKTRRRKRALAGLVRVLFTGLDDEEEHQIVHHLGNVVIEPLMKM